MPIAGSNRFSLNPRARKALALMAAVDRLVIDVDGESSDASSSSLEMISDDTLKETTVDSGSSRVWTEDLYQFLEEKRRGDSRSSGKYAGIVVIEDSSDDESIDGMVVEKDEVDAMEEDDDDEVQLVSAFDKPVKVSIEKRVLEGKLDGGLESLTVGELKELIEGTCSRLKSCLDSLKVIAAEGRAPVLDAGFMGIQPAHFGSNSSDLIKMEQEKELLLRLLFQMQKQFPSLFTPEQMREMDIMLQSVASRGGYKEKDMNNERGCIMNGTATRDIETDKNSLEPGATNSVGPSSGDVGSDKLEQPIISSESLASSAEPMTSKNFETRGATLPHDAMDALKPVSSYQEKYWKTSLLPSNQLPSPTPSGECTGNDDPYGESFSSLSVEGDIGTQRFSSPFQDVRSNGSLSSGSEHLVASGSEHQVASGRTSGINKKTSDRSRDPSRMLFNSEVEKAPSEESKNLSKRRAAKKSELDDDMSKRQRNGHANAISMASQPNDRIQLNGNVKAHIRKLDSGEFNCKRSDAKTNSDGVTGAIEQDSRKSTASNVTLPSFWEDIAATLRGQTALVNAAEKICMKPCDPLRILHDNKVQKRKSLGSEQTKSNGTILLDSQSNVDLLTVRAHGKQAVTASLASRSMFNSHFTCSPALTQNGSEQIPRIIEKVDAVPMAEDLNDQKSVATLFCEVDPGSVPHSSNLWGDVGHLLDGLDDEQKAVIQRERMRRIEEQNKMFAAQKLCLVLDLDHTLLNSVKFEEVESVHDEILRKREEQDRDKPQRHLFRFPHMGMWTKLRPGIWNFLDKASKLYELHLYTMGNKLYATEMAKVLDPRGDLFAGRVIARGDDGDCLDGDERVPKSKDLDGVLGMESAVIIIDDTARVWPHHKANLITVERYTYFPCSRRQFGLPGPSLLEIDRDERAADGTLASSLAVIERIHQDFFSHRSLCEADVRKILTSEQRKVLARCRIVFSRIFPVGEANPHLHPLWQMAEQFGATCTNQIDEQVTHVVATSLGTDKVNWALSTKRFVVRPSWIEASALLYRQADESQFAVKSKKKKHASLNLLEKSNEKTLTHGNLKVS